MKKSFKKGVTAICASAMLALMTPLASFSGFVSEAAEDTSYSEEYKGTEYYTRLQAALTESADQDIMDRVIAVALSQEGYKDYCMSGTTPEAAREAGYLWTGEEGPGDNVNGAGNTEFTRWAQEYIMGRTGQEIYLDCDWCAIFASWCMYQAGYYSEAELKRYFYSYYADPREERNASSWITAFNFDHDKVWYTPAAARKVAAYDWSRYSHTDIDPYEIPYRPGGLIFFSWDTTGDYFNHVGIVVSYDADTHVLTYINGNTDYAVTIREMDLDLDEAYHGQVKALNYKRIMAYAEYGAYKAPEPKEITAEQTSFKWTRGSGESLLVKTNSEAKKVLLTADNGFFDDNTTWPQQLILRYGEITIGPALLDYLPDGENVVTLSFADGSLTIRINITSPLITADKTTFVWKRGSKEGITVKTNSVSETVEVYGPGITSKSKTGEVSIKDGSVTITPRLLERMKNGEGSLALVFDDGGVVLRVTVYVTGWQVEDGVRYYYLKNGTRKTGWLSDGGKWYYLDASGAMQTGWVKWNGAWYYMDQKGRMVTGWKEIGKKWYCFHRDGTMAASEWVGGYWLGKNGAWTYKARGSWHKDSKGWWFGDTTGWYAKGASYIIDGVKYTFDKSGYYVAK